MLLFSINNPSSSHHSTIIGATIANYQANVQIQDYLISRVNYKHHNVKYKALAIIKHVCRTGRPEFKREMQRKVDPIKECLRKCPSYINFCIHTRS